MKNFRLYIVLLITAVLLAGCDKESEDEIDIGQVVQAEEESVEWNISQIEGRQSKDAFFHPQEMIIMEDRTYPAD